MTETKSFQDICNYIHTQCLSYENILVVAHKKCADATASLLAFGAYLQGTKGTYTLWIPPPLLASLSFLYGFANIKTDVQPDVSNFDLIVALDSGDVSQTGLMPQLGEALDRGFPFVINIDHHFTNDGYGQIQLIDKQASATAELVYRYFKVIDFPVTSEMATCLLTGLMTDTGSFSNAATNDRALAVASELLSAGAELQEIVDCVVSPDESWHQLKLWGRVFNRMFFQKEYEMIVSCITQQDLQECGVREEDLDGLANFFNSVKDIAIAMVLVEQSDGTVKGSLRTTKENIDVSQLARVLGGGGHQKAAGFTISGKLVETEAGWRVV